MKFYIKANTASFFCDFRNIFSEFYKKYPLYILHKSNGASTNYQCKGISLAIFRLLPDKEKNGGIGVIFLQVIAQKIAYSPSFLRCRRATARQREKNGGMCVIFCAIKGACPSRRVISPCTDRAANSRQAPNRPS